MKDHGSIPQFLVDLFNLVWGFIAGLLNSLFGGIFG
jgi:hypothetical protein